MKFVFDTKKSIAATAYLSWKSGENSTILFLVKMLYVADREALVSWHRTITGDSPVSMDNGPVLTRIYNLLRGLAKGSDMVAWNQVFQAREGNAIKLKPGVNMDVLLDSLSDREIGALDHACERVMKVKGKLADWAHKTFPEWENPKSSSLPIDFTKVLSIEGFSQEQIKAIEAEVEHVRSVKLSLNAA